MAILSFNILKLFSFFNWELRFLYVINMSITAPLIAMTFCNCKQYFLKENNRNDRTLQQNLDKLPFKILKQTKYDVTFFKNDIYFVCTMSASILTTMVHSCVQRLCTCTSFYFWFFNIFYKRESNFQNWKDKFIISKILLSFQILKFSNW